jgi:hypothetical protein
MDGGRMQQREKKCGAMVYSCMNISLISIWARARQPHLIVDCCQEGKKEVPHHKHSQAEGIPKQPLLVSPSIALFFFSLLKFYFFLS